jgi:hypothetical protein
MYIPVVPNLPAIGDHPSRCPVGQRWDPIADICGPGGPDRSWRWVLGVIGVCLFWYLPIWLFGEETQGHLIVKAKLAQKCPKWLFNRSESPVGSDIELTTFGGRNSDNFSQPDQSDAGDLYLRQERLESISEHSSQPVFGPEPDPDAIEFLPPGVILPYPDDEQEYHVTA